MKDAYQVAVRAGGLALLVSTAVAGCATESPVADSENGNSGRAQAVTDRRSEDDVDVIKQAVYGSGTPAPTTDWPASPSSGSQDLSNGSGWPADSQVAAGKTHVVVTQRASLGFFERDGTQLSNINGASFFSGLLAPGCSGCVFDLRTVYDRYRDRFWIVGLSNSSPVGNGRILIAVSKSEDPTAGWWKYGWNAQSGNSNTGKVDYPSIAITSNALVETHNDHGAGTSIIRVFPADQMASGTSPGNLTGFWAWWGSSVARGDGNDFGIIQPAMNHTGSSTDVFLVNRYGSSGVTVYRITDPLSSSRSIQKVHLTLPTAFRNTHNQGNLSNAAPQLGTSWRIGMYLNDGTGVQTPALKAVSRNSQVYWTAPDAINCSGASGLFAAARVVKLDASNWPTVSVNINRTFGCSSPNDPEGDVYHYGWPSLEVNDLGDIGIVTMRTGTSIYPQIRHHVYGASDSDIRPSGLLYQAPHAYDAANCPATAGWCSDNGMKQLDTAGASLDPHDGTSIWFSHMVPDGNMNQGFNQRIGKVYLGNCEHDLCSAGQSMSTWCDICTATICVTEDPFCCDTFWDSTCVGEVESVCDRSCP